MGSKPISDEVHGQIESTVHHIIVDVLCVEMAALTPEARFRDDLGADSLDLVELTVALGATFQVEVHDERVKNIQTVGETISYLERNLISM